jgi:hypothetical protein
VAGFASPVAGFALPFEGVKPSAGFAAAAVVVPLACFGVGVGVVVVVPLACFGVGVGVVVPVAAFGVGEAAAGRGGRGGARTRPGMGSPEIQKQFR